MKLRLLVSAIALGLILAPAPSLGGTSRVRAGQDTWRPATREVHKHDKVVWKNPSGRLHNVTAYSSNWNKSSPLPPGGKTSKVFHKKGTYKYYCTLHGDVDNGQCEGMCGKIRVLGGG